MSKCDVTIRLERDDPVYRPGEPIRGEVMVHPHETCRTEMLVLSFFWRTHGRGNRKEGSQTMQSLYSGEWAAGETYRYPFEIALPNGPRTYHGNLLNVDWYVAARAKLAWAIDPRAETEVILEPGAAEDYCFGPQYKEPSEALAASGRGRGCGVLFGVIFGGLGLLSVVIIMLALSGEFQVNGSPWIGIALGAVFLLIGVAIILATLRRSLAERKLGVPAVNVSPVVVCPGGTLSIDVKLCPRAAVTLEAVIADLVGLEEVVSGSGTDRTTHRHEVHRRKAVLLEPGRQLEPGEVISLHKELTLPTGAPLTFAAADNELQWKLDVTIGLAGWPDWSRSYPITVRPAALP